MAEKQLWWTLSEDVELRPRREMVVAVNLVTGATLILHPSEAMLLSLLDGRTDRSALLFALETIHGLQPAEAEALVAATWRHVASILCRHDRPVQVRRRYEPARFAYPGFDTPPGDRAPLEVPLSICLVLTRQCNFRCRYCFFGASHPGERLELATIRRVVAEAADLGVVRLDLGGGEPLSHPDFASVIEIIINHALIPSFSTNGSLLDSPMADRLAGAGLRLLQVSLDSARPDVHHHLTGTTNTFQRVLAGIRAARAAGIIVRTRSVLTPENVGDLGELIDLLVDLDVGVMDLTPERPGSHDCRAPAGPPTLDPADRDEAARVVTRKAAQYPGRLIRMNQDDRIWRQPDDIIRCGNLTASCVVHSTGEVGVCEMIRGVADLSYGSIYDAPLKDIWLSEAHRRVWAQAADRTRVDPDCARCDRLDFCRTGCFNLARGEKGDFRARDPRCPGPEWGGGGESLS